MKREAECPIYRQAVIFCDDRAETLKTINRLRLEAKRPLKSPAYVDEADGVCSNAGDYIVLAVFEPDVAVLSHECLHAASKTLRERGIVPSDKDDHESLTYISEWYMDAFIERMGWEITIRRRRR